MEITIISTDNTEVSEEDFKELCKEHNVDENDIEVI